MSESSQQLVLIEKIPVHAWQNTTTFPNRQGSSNNNNGNTSASDEALYITLITINRAKVRNCVDGPTAQSLANAFRLFERDASSHVAILRGQGGYFCAGADLSAIASSSIPSSSSLTSTPKLAGGRANSLSLDMNKDGPMGPSRMQLSKPVIACIEGYAVAGGLELACWCDLRVAQYDSKLGVTCRRFGVPLIDGGTVRLPRLIGQSRAMDMILTGRLVPADEALSFGLVNYVTKSGETLNKCIEIATTLSLFPQACMRVDRESVYKNYGYNETEALAIEFKLGMGVVNDEMVAGATGFASGQVGRSGSFQQWFSASSSSSSSPNSKL